MTSWSRNSFWEELRKRRDFKGKWILKQMTKTWSKGQWCSHCWVWGRTFVHLYHCFESVFLPSPSPPTSALWNRCEIPFLCQEKELKCWGAEISPDLKLFLGARTTEVQMTPMNSKKMQQKFKYEYDKLEAKVLLALDNAWKKWSFRDTKCTPAP